MNHAHEEHNKNWTKNLREEAGSEIHFNKEREKINWLGKRVDSD